MLESRFQTQLIKELKKEFPGCVVLKNDASYLQGVPDLSVFFKDRWAMLEVKKNETATKQPNQEYYVDKINAMSYAAFIYPENKTKIMDELKKHFNK